jgi:hypothetical protein
MKKTPIGDPVGTEEILWIKKDGGEVLITAKVGRPYQVDGDTWSCPAELKGVDKKYPDIHGSGSMQALCLAIGLIKMRLGHLLEDGETLHFRNDRRAKLNFDCLDAVFGK